MKLGRKKAKREERLRNLPATDQLKPAFKAWGRGRWGESCESDRKKKLAKEGGESCGASRSRLRGGT